MHELGIVVHISKTLEELAQENNITDIRRVTLQIGKVSGIVPEYLVEESVHIVRVNIQFFFKVMSVSLRRLKPNKRRKALFLEKVFFCVYEYVGNAY